MSFLFPLYALGALALAAPLFFHLFQRRPQGQQEFSSLMFLRSTPPKLTRRSRLNDILLLVLRGLALALLVAAFCRPFLRSSSLLEVEAPLRSVALLIDTSASMRRDGVWENLQQVVTSVVKDLRPSDQVMLASFDRKPNTLISFETWEQTLLSRRLPLLKEQIETLEPTWRATDLDSALISAGDALLQLRLGEDQGQPLQVVVFSDLQEGSDLSGLQSYQWPKDISVDVRTVAAAKQANASLQALPAEAGDMDSAQIRVLVRNEANSSNGKLQLAWESDDARPIATHVPPGQSRVVRVTQPRGALQLNLKGDDHQFDNSLYLTQMTPLEQKLWYVGDDQAEDQQGLLFYLRQSTLDTRTRNVLIEKLDELTALAVTTPQQVPLMVVSKPLTGNALIDLKNYVVRGGRVLIVLNASSDTHPMEQFLGELLGLTQVAISAAPGEEYAILANIDFQNPLLLPFADPRFNDFSKIQFWSHQRITSSDGQPWSVVAQFDDDTPALAEKRLQDGIVWVLTSGWQPEVSQLALSSKFVPLLHSFFGRASDGNTDWVNHQVGEQIRLTATQSETNITTPDGGVVALPPMTESFNETNDPGIYQIQQGTNQFLVAVNLPPAESQTDPLAPDRLEQLGLSLGKQKTVAAMRTEQRQMRAKELEGRQKLWRWGILAALTAITLETWLSGRTEKVAVYSQ